MSTNTPPIYSFLPAVFRTRDAALGTPLQELFAVLESQYGIVQDNLAQLYDDQFIETCAPWVIPYIGQLIGYNTVYTAALSSPDSRAEVANTVGYRRRKGTLIALEQITHDVSGRTTAAVEEFRRLVTTLSLRDVRAHHHDTASLRSSRDWEDQNGPFSCLNRTIDVRNISPRVRMVTQPDATPLDIAIHGGGSSNIPEVAVWMWRWQSWTVADAPPFPLGKGGFFFSALGRPIPLFQATPQETAPFYALTTEGVVPEPISIRQFAENLAGYYPSSFQLRVNGKTVPIGQIMCANLAEAPDGSVCTVPKGMIAIDPERGRIQYAADLKPPSNLAVTYNYGAPAPIAGGPYDRSPIVQPGSDPTTEFVNSAKPFYAVVPSPAYPTLKSAVVAWNQLAPNSAGTILLSDFESYNINLTGSSAIKLPAESLLLIASASFTKQGVPEWTNACATLHGNIEVVAPAPKLGPDGVALPTGQLQISGIWLSGQLIFSGGDAGVQISDSTLVPGIAFTSKGEPAHPAEPSVTVAASTTPPVFTLCLNRVITGPIALPATCSARICSSIVDAGSPYCPAFAGPDLASPGASLYIEESTVIGRVRPQAIRLASNTIFYARLGCNDPWPAPVWANRVQTGCVRFCWLPAKSITPRQYQCLPPDADSQPALEPKFITLRFGLPGFCLLSGDTPMAVWKGADNSSQIGVYYQIQETEAVTNVQIRSAEYLPANLQSGVFLIPSQSLREEIPHFQYGYAIRRPCEMAGDDDDTPTGIGVGLI
ncbi:MAG TPA: hypothetical protein VG267_10245 [Terracidiphilus sp.]|jgi:hypothetical protein|nr:hypothetical protein [Terracidiphilus sp.]